MGIMNASRFESPRFPTNNVDIVKRYRFYSNVAAFLGTVARLDGTFDTFITQSPYATGRLIRARRDISVEVYDAQVRGFVHPQELADVLDADATCADLEFSLSYSYLNERYDKIPFKGDVFLMRAAIEADVLTLKIYLEDGLGRTEGGMLAHMVADVLRRCMR